MRLRRTALGFDARVWVGLIVLLSLSCMDVTGPGAAPVIVITYQGDTTLVAGTRVTPRISVTVDGTEADQPRLKITTSDATVVFTPLFGDTLFGIGRGSATITISLVGSTLSENPPSVQQVIRGVADHVNIDPTSVLLESLNDTMTVTAVPLSFTGDTLQATAQWASDSAAIATVDDTGLLTAIKNGTANISAVVDDDTASVTVVVSQKLHRIGLAPEPVIINSITDTVRMLPTPFDSGGSEIPAADAPAVGWEMRDSVIATVSSDGVVTAVENGETYVRARSNEVLDSARVEVVQIANRVQIFGPREIAYRQRQCGKNRSDFASNCGSA